MATEPDPFFESDQPRALTAELAKLTMEPGDVLVVRLTSPNVQVDQVNRVSEALKAWKRDNGVSFPLLVLGPGMEVTKVESPK